MSINNLEIQKLIENKSIFINATLQWQKDNYPARTVEYEKCARNLNFVFDAYVADLTSETINNISYIGSKFWVNKERQIYQYEVELEIHSFLVEQILKNIPNTDAGNFAKRLTFLKDIFFTIIKTGPITGIENLYSKRRQIRAAWDQQRIPSKELIHNLLKSAQNVSPSKQNLFPFKIHAFGPDNVQDQDIISQICCLWDKGAVNQWDVDRDTNNIDNLKRAPWVLVFESRLCDPNTFVLEHSELVNEKHWWIRFTQCDKDRFRNLCNTKLTSIEVGMFVQTLAGVCLEHDLAISYIRSFPDWVWKDKEQFYKKNKNKQGLDWDALPCITEQPLLVVQIGYKHNSHDILATNVNDRSKRALEDKPDINTIVEYHEK